MDREATIDDCPRCGDDKLRGYEGQYDDPLNFPFIVCWTCEWSIDKTAWLEAWK